MKDSDLAKVSALVVDDETFMRQLIGRLLNDIGVRNVAFAGDGADAMSKFSDKTRNFDLVVCDLEMPKMDGFEFVKRLRARADLPCRDVPVLIVTGHSQEDNVVNAVKMGIHGFLVKPISKQALESRVRSAIGAAPIDPAALKR